LSAGPEPPVILKEQVFFSPLRKTCNKKSTPSEKLVSLSNASEQRIVKVFYLNTNIVRTHERNAGRGVPLLVVAEHAIGTTADRLYNYRSSGGVSSI